MPRSWFGRGRQRAGVALATYTVLALALTWPLAAHFTTHVTGDGIDDPALTWNLWWVKLRLVDQLNPDLFHSGWMFHPVDINLAFYTLTPLNGLLSIPPQLAFGLTVATNLLLLASFVLSGFGAYLLVRELLQIWGWEERPGSWPGFAAALLAGGIYAFASAKLFYAALGQFNIASSQWIPFCALYLVRMVHARNLRGKLREAALAGVFLVFQAWAELTYASFLLLLIGLLFLWAMLFGEGWRGRLRDTAAFLLVGALFVMGLLPFLAAMAPDLAAEGDFFGRGGGFADVFSADLAGYLAPTRLHPLVGAWVAGLPFPNDKGQQIYLGYTVLLLALAGAWGLWRGLGQGGADRVSAAVTRRWLLFWGAAAGLFFLLTLGPQLRWAGQPLPVPLPFALVSRLPFFSGNRYPSRYSVMLLLAAAVLAGAGVCWLLTRPAVRAHKGWAAAALAGVACLMLLEHLSVPAPLSSQQIPAIYARLAAAQARGEGAGAGAGALLELPTGWRNGARVLGKSDLLIMAQQLYQAEHGLRRLGGNTSRNPEFKFQYFTDAPLLGDLIALFNADQSHMAPVIEAELDEMIARDRPLAARVLDFLGIRYVTVDVEKSPPALLRFVDEALPLALLAEEQGVRSDGTPQTMRLYAVAASPSVTATQRSALDGTLANLYLGEGWSPAVASEGPDAVRYAVRAQPALLVNVPDAGARLVLEWAAPLASLGATVNGRAVTAAPIDGDGRRWALDVGAGVGDQPVDHVVLELPGPGVAGGEAAVPPAGQGWAIGATGVELAPGAGLLVRSAGQETGDFAHIWLNGVDVADGERGYNLAALDTTGKLLGGATFDTLAAEEASAAMADWLRSWPAGTIVAGAVGDEASLKLGEDAVAALQETGVATDLRDKFRWSHAFVGVRGAAPGTAVEDVNLLRPAVVAVGPPVSGPRVFGQLQGLEIDQTN